MGNHSGDANWFIDIRFLDTPEKISLDLSRHLPRRASVGQVAVVADRPLVFLSVIRKRWAKVVREVERQYASTLDRNKKTGLEQELQRLRSYSFAAYSAKHRAADILFITPADLEKTGKYHTLYLTVCLPHKSLSTVISHIYPHGLLVTYNGEPEEYCQAARDVQKN